LKEKLTKNLYNNLNDEINKLKNRDLILESIQSEMVKIDEEIEELRLRISSLQMRKIEMQAQHDDFNSLANNICVKDIDKR